MMCAVGHGSLLTRDTSEAELIYRVTQGRGRRGFVIRAQKFQISSGRKIEVFTSPVTSNVLLFARRTPSLSLNGQLAVL